MSWKSLLVVGFTVASLVGKLPAAESDDGTADATYELRYQFSAGQELYYRILDQRRMEIQVAEFQDTVRHSTNALRRHRVEAVDTDGNSRIEILILDVEMTAESGEDIFIFKRGMRPVPAVFQGVESTMGRPLGLVTVSPLGATIDTELLIASESAAEFESAQSDFLPLLPESTVAIGDTWRDPFEVDILVDADQETAEQPLKKRIQLQRIYSLESVEDGIATIAVRTVVLSPVRDGFQRGQLIQRTTHGTVQLDIKRGLLLDRSVTLDNTVVGFNGPQSLLSVEGSHQDALVPETDLGGADSAESATR